LCVFLLCTPNTIDDKHWHPWGLHEIGLNCYLNFEQLNKTLIIPQLMLGVFRK
jgi:hypothetical protein